MELERVTHYVDNVLTQAEARMGLRNTKLLVAWYTNQKNDQSVVHSHPYHELVLPIGGSQTTAPSSTNVLVQRAVSYLQAHYQDPTLTTVKLAQELYASREHLSRAFKECTMESIHSYLTHLRMQHCRKALEDGVSVLNACTESGFPDYSSFLKTFRRLYGITPAEYRSQNRKKV